MSGRRRKIAFGDLYVLVGTGPVGLWSDRDSYSIYKSWTDCISSGDLVVFLERTNNLDATINLKVITTTGKVGWIMHYADRWFRYDFSSYLIPCQH